MEIQFLHLPRFAVRHFLLIVFIRRQRNGRLSRVRRRPMRAVAVFAVHVLRHHDVRPARAISLGDKTIDALPAPSLLGIHPLERQLILIREMADHRVILHPAEPQTVQQFQPPIWHRRHKVGHLHLPAHFPCVIGNRAAQKQQFIVRVRRQRQQIRLVERRFPLLHPVRCVALAKDVQLGDKQPPLTVLRTDTHSLSPRVQRNILVQKAAAAHSNRPPCARVVRGLHFQRRYIFIKLHIQAADGFLRFDLHIGVTARRRGPIRLILPIRHASQRLFAYG